MIGIGTILSVVGGVSEAINVYKFGSTLAKGSDADRVLGALDRIHATVERLTDNILYAPGIEGLSPVAGAAQRVGDLREARALLEPVQAALGGEIVSSGLIETPDKMERAMLENPWAVLEDIRPQHLAVRQANPDKVPVLFVHNGVRYIGWQMRGALPVLFNCELHDLPGLGGSLRPDVRDKPRGGSIPANQPQSSPHAVAQNKNAGSATRIAQPTLEAEKSAKAVQMPDMSQEPALLQSAFVPPDQNATAPQAAAGTMPPFNMIQDATMPSAALPVADVPGAVTAMGILFIVQALVRAGFLVNILQRAPDIFYADTFFVVRSIAIPAVLVVGGLTAGILVLKRAPAVYNFCITFCGLGLLFSVYVFGTVIYNTMTVPSFDPSWIVWTVSPVYIAIYLIGLIVFMRAGTQAERLRV